MSQIYSVISHAGRREQNEDAFHASTQHGLYLVCDGVGGHEHGGLAAHTAVASIVSTLRQRGLLDTEREVEISRAEAKAALQSAFMGAQRELEQASERFAFARPMATTAAVAWMYQPEHLALASVGDSRIYRLPAVGGLELLTVDHTVYSELCQFGQSDINPRPFRNVLTRSLGADGAGKPDISFTDFRAGDRLLLCTHGVTNSLSDDEIEARGRDVRLGERGSVVQRIVQDALMRDGDYNATALIVESMPIIQQEDFETLRLTEEERQEATV